jgi:hypothetical protein
MGTSTNAAAFAGKLHTFAVALPSAGAAGLVKAALTVQAAVATASGRYRGHAIVDTSQTVTGSVALVRMTSRKAHLLDHDTHFPQASRALGVSSEFVPRTGVRTQGKFMWERGVAAARPGVVVAMGRAVGDAMTKVFSR